MFSNLLSFIIRRKSTDAIFEACTPPFYNRTFGYHLSQFLWETWKGVSRTTLGVAQVFPDLPEGHFVWPWPALGGATWTAESCRWSPSDQVRRHQVRSQLLCEARSRLFSCGNVCNSSFLLRVSSALGQGLCFAAWPGCAFHWARDRKESGAFVCLDMIY